MKAESGINIENNTNPTVYIIDSPSTQSSRGTPAALAGLKETLEKLKKRIEKIEKSLVPLPSASSALEKAKAARRKARGMRGKNNKILVKYKRKTKRVCTQPSKKKQPKAKNVLKSKKNVGGYNEYWIQ